MKSEPIIFDSILGNASAARVWIDRVLAGGRRAVVRYVHRNFADAVQANLSRAHGRKPLATAAEIARAHSDARQAL